MDIELNGEKFDVQVSGFLNRLHFLKDVKTVAATLEQQVYLWNCRPPGKGKFIPPANAKGQIPLPNLVVFAEHDGTVMYFPELDPKASRAMQQRYLAKTAAKSLADLKTAVDRKFRIPVIDIPTKTFGWMDPTVTYVINMSIDYVVARLANAKLGLGFWILIPHRARFAAQVLDYCKPVEFAESEASGQDPDTEKQVFYARATPRNRAWRRKALWSEISRIELHPFGASKKKKAEAERMRRELTALTD